MLRGCGIIPVALKNDKLYVLCGIYNNCISDLGGKIECNETLKQCAAREFYEESVGLLMSYDELLHAKVYKKIKLGKEKYYMSLIIKVEYKDVEQDYAKLMRYIKKHKCKGVKMDVKKYKIEQLYTQKIYPYGFFEFDRLKWFELEKLKKINKNKLSSRLNGLLHKIY